MRQTMYVVINKDLNMSPGKIAAQVAHAVFDYIYKEVSDAMNNSLKMAQHDLIELSYEMDTFKQNGDTICVLKASENELLRFKEEGYITVIDRGLTEIPESSITAVNLGIYDKDKPDDMPKFIRKLRLL